LNPGSKSKSKSSTILIKPDLTLNMYNLIESK
jgi:hypothetical protein